MLLDSFPGRFVVKATGSWLSEAMGVRYPSGNYASV
jgi:hypothetical protein